MISISQQTWLQPWIKLARGERPSEQLRALAKTLLVPLAGIAAFLLLWAVAAGQIKLESLRGWMTLPYIAKVYGVPESRLRETLGLPPTGDEDRSLRSWLDLQGIDPVSGRARIEALILAETIRREAPGD